MTNSTTVDKGNAMPNCKIASTIVDFGASNSVIDATLMAYTELFVSDGFAESSIDYRRAIAFDFKLLIDTLFEIKEVERIEYTSKA